MVTQSQPAPMHAPESAYARLLQPPPPPTSVGGDGSGAQLLTIGEPSSCVLSSHINTSQPSSTHQVYYNLTSMPESTCSTSMYLGESPIVTSGVGMELQSASIERELPPRKRKSSFSKGSDLDDDFIDDAKSFRTNEDNKKQNHSEIEKRRRDKMNTYITELSAMVPMCHAMSRKLDKLTVLRMAVQHLKTIRGAAVHSYTEGHYKPAFLSDQELKTLILQAAEGFLFVVGCDRGRILYVSESVSQILNYSQGDLLGQSWFDILHPKDVAKVKEQLSSPDLNPRERLIDAKTMLPVRTDVPQGGSRLCPGARRSFFCRMKCKITPQIKEEADTTTGGCQRRKKHQNLDRKYSVIQCTGYLKSWTPAKMGLDEQEPEVDGEACNLSCLVAVGREQPPFPPRHLVSQNVNVKRPPVRNIQFISRHAIDGKFLFIDQRATLVLGFLPQELLGTSMYEHYHNDDINHLAEAHKAALQSSQSVNTQLYRFRSRNGCFVKLQSEWKSFRNPWTKDIEYLVGKNSVIISDSDSRLVESSIVRSEEINPSQGSIDFFTQTNGDKDMQRLITSHVEVSKIGRQIAEEVLDLQRRNEDSSYSDSPNSDSDQIAPKEASPGFVELKLQFKVKNSEEQSSPSAQLEGIQSHHQSQSGSNINSTTTENSSQNGAQSFQVRNNEHLSLASNSALEAEEDMMEMINTPIVSQSPNHSVTNDGNDEAAMAVIMSLLEADAGLGGPVDFSGLPWPLP